MEKKCKYCAMMIPQEARICPYCRKQLVTSRRTKFLLVFIILIVFMAWFRIISYHNSGPGSKSTPSISLGEVGILSGSSGTHTLVAVTEEVLDQFIKARVAKDEYGEGLILGSDLVFLVKNGTKVRVIEHGKGIFKRKIRILEGEMKDCAGYVPYEWVKPL